MKERVEEYYDHSYFEKYQKKIGEFGGRANLFKFEPFIKADDTVLDFGCGGGFLLKELKCAKKIGVELNPVAREYCNTINNIDCYESLDEIKDNSLNVIISNHCLEHTTSPYKLIEKMYSKLVKGGRLIVVVPLDSYRYSWHPNDVNNHLYSFSPMNIGNLLQACEFFDIKTDVILHKWPPFYQKIEKHFGKSIFHFFCRIYGLINKRWVQVRGIGTK